MLFLFVSVFIIKVDNTPLGVISTWPGEPIFCVNLQFCYFSLL